MALSLLREGGVLIHPCDETYGIIGKAPDTAPRIGAITHSRDGMPLQMLVSDLDAVECLVRGLPDERLLDFWPGRLDLLLTSRSGEKIRLCIPEDEDLRDLIADLGAPVYCAAVKRPGAEPCWEISGIRKEFEDRVDLVVDAGDLPGWIPMTVIDATSRPCRIIRQGAVIVPESLLA